MWDCFGSAVDTEAGQHENVREDKQFIKGMRETRWILKVDFNEAIDSLHVLVWREFYLRIGILFYYYFILNKKQSFQKFR